MKLKTAINIETAMPYAMSILAAGATFAAFRIYAEFCEKIGFDCGTDAALKAFANFDPKAHDELLEDANPPWNFEN